MDRGRIKKIKSHPLVGSDNPGFNAFQETQNQIHRRWTQSSGGRPHFQTFRQNPHHNHHRNHFRGGRHQNRNFGNRHHVRGFNR